jgi:hypothetical protein
MSVASENASLLEVSEVSESIEIPSHELSGDENA